MGGDPAARLGADQASAARGRDPEPHDGSRRPLHEAPALPGGAHPRLLDRGPRRARRGAVDAGGGPAHRGARARGVAPSGGGGPLRASHTGAVPAALSSRIPVSDDLVRRLHAVAGWLRDDVRRWEAARDRRAVFGYAYATITERIAEVLPTMGFDDPAWVVALDEAFAAEFRRAADAVRPES